MIEVLDEIKYNFLCKISDDNYSYNYNFIYMDFDSVQSFYSIKDEIIQNINNYYLPFFQNLDRLDD